jgi:ABC-2 type transport system permease protein
MDAVGAIWLKHMTKFLRSREELGGLLIQPILWVAIFGTGMRSLGQTGDTDYLTFMLPGILALTALGGAVGGGMVLLEERLSGTMDDYLVAPIPRLSILLGNAASSATKALIQAGVILVVGLLFGTAPVVSIVALVALIGALVLFTIGFAGIALAVAARTRSIMGYHGLIALFNLPLLFASNALYPLDRLPDWVRALAMANPTTYLIEALRASVYPAPVVIAPLVAWGVLIGFAVLGGALALASFQRSVQRRS